MAAPTAKRDIFPRYRRSGNGLVERSSYPSRRCGQSTHTLCHFDITPNNLFSRRNADGNDQTVLIDWSFVGYGVLGEDIINLVLDSVFLLFVNGSSLIPLEKLVLEGYLTGLRSAGWNGDERVVRFTYTALAALHFG